MKQLVAFDLDGTLAESKQAIDQEMGGLLILRSCRVRNDRMGRLVQQPTDPRTSRQHHARVAEQRYYAMLDDFPVAA